MFINTPRFPASIARGAVGGPRFLTEVVASQGGAEQRNQKWRRALGQYEIGLVHKDEALTRELFAFFRAVARGQLNTFRFRDFLPGESHMEREPFATTTGSDTTYQLVRRYVAGAESYVRSITKPVVSTMRLWLDGVEITGWAADELTGIITPASLLPGGKTLAATCDFDVPVRFTVDTLPIKRVDHTVFSWDSIPLIEIREP